jgi:large repetitive protein
MPPLGEESDLRLQFRAPVRRLAGVALLAAAALLSACSSSPRNALNPVTTVDAGVSLATSTNSTVMQAGETLTLTAVVSVDPNAEGVTFALSGPGTLQNQAKTTSAGITSTTIDYVAPSNFDGIVTPVITATSIHDNTKTNSGTLLVNGRPIIDPPSLFPANVGTAYAAAVTATGGKAPYVWTVDSGTLPSGITLGATTTQFAPLTGTPAAGSENTYNFVLKVVDANSDSATVNVTLVVNAAAACLLNGNFALLETGFVGNRFVVGGGAYSVNGTTGAVSGSQDFGAATSIGEAVTGTCAPRINNSGTLTLTGATRSPIFNFAVPVGLASGRVQLVNGGDTTVTSGSIAKQDASAFNLAALAGDYAFGALGTYAPGSTNVGQRVGVAGRFTVDANGLVTNGRLDANTTQVANSATFTSGTMSAPDANGRGTLSFNAAGQQWTFHYYVISSGKLYLVATDPANNSPQVAGSAKRQFGTFDATSLSTQGVVSLWGASGQDPPHAVLALGRLSAANATAQTLNATFQIANHASNSVDKADTAATYTVSADGRATFTFNDGTTTHNYVAYLDGAEDGYVVEPVSVAGVAGLLEAQIAAPYSSTLPGVFIYGSQFVEDPGPVTLLPTFGFNSGQISSGNGIASGSLGLETTTGRAIGTFAVAGGQSVVVTYVVDTHHVRMLRFGQRLVSPVIEFIDSQ